MYDNKQWEVLLNKTIEAIRTLATIKGGEYAGDEDRLANFKRNALTLGLTPEAIWAVYAAKHWDAIQQYCKDIQAGKERARAEPITSRLDDLIVYCILQKAMWEERNRTAQRAAQPEQKPPSQAPHYAYD